MSDVRYSVQVVHVHGSMVVDFTCGVVVIHEWWWIFHAVQSEGRHLGCWTCKWHE